MQMQTHQPARSTAIAVVIPHLNKIAETRACYASLEGQRIPARRIVIVDNGSTTHSEQALAEACPGTQVLRLDRNRGFAGAVNTGIRLALQDPAITHILILNNDTSCPPDALEALLATSEEAPRNGITGCLLLEGEENARKVVPPGKYLQRPWCLPVPTRPGQPPSYLAGTCLLLKRELLEDIGLFDEGFFFFWEDADFSLRAQRADWQLAVANNLMVEHRGSSTARCFSTLLARGYRAGHLRFLHKYYRYPRLRALPPFLFRLLADAGRGQWAAVRGNCGGFRAGWHACRTPTPPPEPQVPT